MYFAILSETGPWPPGLKRELPRAQKKAFLLAGNRWHQSFSREHFKMSAIEKYKYDARTKKYLKRKQALKHHQLPLVYSGVTRNRALQRDVRSTSKKAVVTLHVPALNFRQLYSELTRVTLSEVKVLGQVFANSIENSFQRVQSGKKIIIK